MSEDSHQLTTRAHHDLGGFGDGMQLLREGPALYVGHVGDTGIGTSILDVSDLDDVRLVRQWRAPDGSNTKKLQVANGYLITNQEPFKHSTATEWAAGMPIYKLDTPFEPRLVGNWNVGGKGVHRIVWDGGQYAYLSARPPEMLERIWMIVDMTDPANPVEAGRWWWPGQAPGEEPTWPEGRTYKAHHALIEGDRAYLGYLDAGMVILDISEVSAPRFIESMSWPGGEHTHTCMPLKGRKLVVTSDEPILKRSDESERLIHLIDVSDELHPRMVATCPAPEGDFDHSKGRLGPHNFHENRPGSYQSAELVFVSYFSAGVRVYDLADPAYPREVAHWVPECPPKQAIPQINDIFVDEDCYVYVSDRVTGGIYILEPSSSLRDQMERSRLPQRPVRAPIGR